ncbi:hypothetical protein QEG73_13365 [Chitinophagaceae bacterium 26-R-25]|nr:hypothetical protein [Chitinophagaceae bacterium 26-R-25]
MTPFSKKMAMVILTVAIIIAGCKKPDDSNPSQTALLTTGSWKLTSLISDPAEDWDRDGIPDREVMQIFQECLTDNILTFRADGGLVNDEGASKCYGVQLQTEITHWSFFNDGTKIIMAKAGSLDTVELLELSRTVLKIKGPFGQGGGGLTVILTQTYGH